MSFNPQEVKWHQVLMWEAEMEVDGVQLVLSVSRPNVSAKWTGEVLTPDFRYFYGTGDYRESAISEAVKAWRTGHESGRRNK